MPKKKCTPKQLAALARGRAIRQKKITKASYKKPKCKSNKTKRKTGEDYTDDEIYSYMPPEFSQDYQPEPVSPEKYLPPPPTHDFPNPSDYPDPPINDEDQPIAETPKLHLPVIQLNSTPPEKATAKEKKQDKEDQKLFNKIKTTLESDPKYKNTQEPTVTMAYNGIPIKVPMSLMPKDKTFYEKYGGMIKDLAMIGLMGYGGSKILHLAGAPFRAIGTAKDGAKTGTRTVLHGLANLLKIF